MRKWNLWDEAERISLEFKTFQREMRWPQDAEEMYDRGAGKLGCRAQSR